MRNIYTVASSSSSTTYGNIMSFIKDKISQYFPIGFFNDINLSSEIAYVNIRRRLGRNSLIEMAKLEKPFMNISPQIDVPSGDQYLYDIPLTKNFDNMEYGIEVNTLFPILRNVDDGYSFEYKLNRDQIRFDVIITLESRIQQLDLYKYIVNYMTWERPFTVKTALEAMIPREIIKHMGLLSNIDIDNSKSNQIPIILQMMNRHSNYPITYKMRNGTALDEFFMYYNAEVLMTFSDLGLDDVTKKNFVDDFYQIKFTCTTEFNLPGMFVLIGEKPKPRMLDVDLVVKEKDGYNDFIPLFTINNFYARYPAERNGFMYYLNTRFKTCCEKGKTSDSLDISSLFDDDKVRIISTYQANNIPIINTLVDIILLQDDDTLPIDLWDIDWAKWELNVKEANDDATYCLIIYINNNLFVEETANKIENEKNDKPRI